MEDGKMGDYYIAVIGGDGTGPEVIKEGRKVLEAAGRKHSIRFNFHEFDFGGERYLRTGETLPDSALEELKKFDAIYFGAIGHPGVKPGVLEGGILLKARFELDQYINLRPVRLYPGVETPLANKKPEDIDFTVIRENTGGLYTGQGGVSRKGTKQEVATQLMVYDREMVDRCLKYAFEYTNNMHKQKPWRGLSRQELESGKTGKLTLVHKTNVLTNCGDLWKRAFDDMAEDFKGIQKDYNHVDACTMWMVKNPEFYDVIVTENMFGDIITDLGAMVQGGMGIAAGGNINPNGVSMFEPIGGSAPKYTGKNVICPLAAIEAGRMMLNHLGETKAAKSIEDAVAYMCANKIKSVSAGKMGFSTTEVGDMIAEYIAKN
jgi:3-isopropylmalate dehydrogenase